MLHQLLVWAAVAVVGFWAVGAYNRLMRLRAETKAAFGRLDAALGRLTAQLDQVSSASLDAATVAATGAASDVTSAAASAAPSGSPTQGARGVASGSASGVTSEGASGVSSSVTGLAPTGPAQHVAQAAGTQCAACLTVARQSPLDAAALAPLELAVQVLISAWADATAQAMAQPHSWAQSHEWLHEQTVLARQIATATHDFNAFVVRHNQAIAQFPALLLAKSLGLRPARGLALPGDGAHASGADAPVTV